MHDFQFYSTSSLDDALKYLSETEGLCKIIAGGTDLIPMLRNEDIYPNCVLNILGIEQLRGIVETDHAVRIGPTTTYTEIVESEVLNRFFPILVQAASNVGGPQIRNRGTIGGNIATASPAADVLPALMALDVELELQSKKSGVRLLPLTDGIESAYRSRLRADEIMTGILIKKLPEGTRCGFEKLGRRKAMARARMNMSVILRLDKDWTVSEVRIVPGAVMPVAKRIKTAEKVLLGVKPEEALVKAAGEVLVQEILKVTGIRWSTEYKMPVVRNIFERVVGQLI